MLFLQCKDTCSLLLYFLHRGGYGHRNMCVCVCVCERERESVCVRERERESECACESVASEAKVLSLKSPNFFSTPLEKVHSSHTLRGCLNEKVEKNCYIFSFCSLRFMFKHSHMFLFYLNHKLNKF